MCAKCKIALAYQEHCNAPHNADFEVCDNPRCALAYSAESDLAALEAENREAMRVVSEIVNKAKAPATPGRAQYMTIPTEAYNLAVAVLAKYQPR